MQYKQKKTYIMEEPVNQNTASLSTQYTLSDSFTSSSLCKKLEDRQVYYFLSSWSFHIDVRHEKIELKVFVVFIPKEG